MHGGRRGSSEFAQRWGRSSCRLCALQGILPVKTLVDGVVNAAERSAPKLLTGAPPCIVLARHGRRLGVEHEVSQPLRA